jgi:biotin carboxyl carrier protein
LKFKLTIDGRTHEVEVAQQDSHPSPSPVTVNIDGKTFAVSIVERDETSRTIRVKVGEKQFKVGLEKDSLTNGRPSDVNINDIPFRIQVANLGVARPAANLVVDGQTQSKIGTPTTKAAPRQAASGEKAIKPPMPGKIISVKVRQGDMVKAGDVVLILEAMKMANEIASPFDGKIKEVRVSNGQSVAPDDSLIVIE